MTPRARWPGRFQSPARNLLTVHARVAPRWASEGRADSLQMEMALQGRVAARRHHLDRLTKQRQEDSVARPEVQPGLRLPHNLGWDFLIPLPSEKPGADQDGRSQPADHQGSTAPTSQGSALGHGPGLTLTLS